ncbi:MAG: hypothetical protein M5U25_06135 [Planctomycetota bacterium]|nr:hypothetical protein [Planctomycetota bacterium]
MGFWKFVLAVLAMVCLSASVPTLQAQEKGAEGDKPAEEKKADEKEAEGDEEGDDEEEENADPVENMKKMFKDVDKVIDTVKIAEADIESYLKHNKSFDEAMEKDEKFEELKEKNIKEAFDHALKSESYKAWAEKNELKAEDYLRKSIRIMILNFRVNFGPQIKEQLDGLAEQRKMVESAKESIPAEDYNEAIKALDEADKMLKGMSEIIDGLPAGSDEEKKLIEKYAEKLEEVESDE